MRKPLENPKIFAERRARIAENISGAAIILSSPPEAIRNGNVHFPFHQDSNLYYLTGFEEPETILVFRPGMTPETVLFVRRKNPDMETWDGFMYGVEGAAEQFRMDKTYPIEEFEKVTTDLLKGCDKLYYRFYKNPKTDSKIQNILLNHKLMSGRSGLGLLSVHDSDELIGEYRLFKGEADLANMRKACDITAEAHTELMKYVKPGMSERELHGYFLYQIMKRGAAREGYGGIFASGNAATTLHYVFNDQPLKDNDILLVDAAGEYNYFTSDITRSYPVNGRFTDEQAEVYQGVLNVQKAIIESVKPGVEYQSMQVMATDMLTELMLELGLLTGRKEDIIKANEQRKYYPHGAGHFLGMDVHDSGIYLNRKGEKRLLEENMVFTVEPGLYIPAGDKNAAPEYQGIGIRIEDNIRVTRQGAEILTAKAPKEITDLEKIIGTH